MEALGILTHDYLDLREETEDVNMLSGSEEDESPKKVRRKEGRGFGGTLLGGGGLMDPSSHLNSEVKHPSPVPAVKPCSACTFENAFDVSKCSICDTPFVL